MKRLAGERHQSERAYFVNERHILANGNIFYPETLLKPAEVLGTVHFDAQSQADELIHWTGFLEIGASRCRAALARQISVS
jgi:hypothetical protein